MTKDEKNKAIQYAVEITTASASASVQKGKPDTIFKDVYQAIKNVFEESN